MQRKLIIVIGGLEVGGTERHLTFILPLLVAKGWSVQVFILTKKGALAPALEAQGVSVSCLLSPSQLSLVQKLPLLLGHFVRVVWLVINLAKKLRKIEEDVILHFFLPEAYIIGMFGTMLAGFKGPKLMSRRSLNNYQKRRPGIGWLERKLHPKVTAVVANSAVVMSQLEQEEGVPISRLKLIYNGINLGAFTSTRQRRDSRESLGISNNALVMIMIANIIPYKGHRDLLYALDQIKSKLPEEWYLICAGRDDGIGSALREIAESLKLSKHILWLESRRDVPDLLALSDIGVLCSHEEGFSNAVLESMAAGLPMVVTDVGGNKEAVVDGKTGYVVKARDCNALAQAILKLVEDPQQSKQFGQAGYARVKEYFSIDNCIDAYVKLYEEYLVPHLEPQQIQEI
jgi:glycosyltransferase involved in cell wall biosynthesis